MLAIYERATDWTLLGWYHRTIELYIGGNPQPLHHTYYYTRFIKFLYSGHPCFISGLYIPMRSRRVRRRTRVGRNPRKSKKRTRSRRAGSNWKSLQTQTIREKNEQLQRELRACVGHQQYLREYVKNLENELAGVKLELGGVSIF